MVEMRFEDRRRAGALLGEEISGLEPEHPLVLALPRGGVPVGYEVARKLRCRLDVLLVRKLGVPGQPELAMGAIAEGGIVIRNPDIISLAGVSEDDLQVVMEWEKATLARRGALYRDGHDGVDPGGRTVLIVDDGLATGATAMAAVEAVRARGAREVWVCVPVAPVDTVAAMEDLADRVVVLHTPAKFMAVGVWYHRFGQTSDEEVRKLLGESRLR